MPIGVRFPELMPGRDAVIGRSDKVFGAVSWLHEVHADSAEMYEGMVISMVILSPNKSFCVNIFVLFRGGLRNWIWISCP